MGAGSRAWVVVLACVGCGGNPTIQPDAASELDASLDAAPDAAPDAGPLVCEPLTADCNGALADGCEADLARSEAECSGCTAPCSAGLVCIASACTAPLGPVGWVRTAGTNDVDSGFAVAIDPGGGVVFAGITRGAIDVGGGPLPTAGSQGSFIASYAADGTHRWSRVLVSVEVEDVGVDSAGNVYVVGDFQNTVNVGGSPLVTSGGVDAMVASFASNGGHRWSRAFGAGGFDTARGIAVALDGTSWVTGTFSGPTNFGAGTLTPAGLSDIYVLNYDAAGVLVAANKYGGTGTDNGKDVALDAAGNVFVVGEASTTANFGGGPLPSVGLFIASFTPAAAHRWSNALGATFNSRMSRVTVDDTGTAYAVARHTAGFVADGSVLIASYSNSGTPGWSRLFGLGTHTGTSVSAGANLYLTGYFDGTINLGGSDLGGTGFAGSFVASFTPAGVHRWSRAVDGVVYWSVAADRVTDVYVAVGFDTMVDFGDGIVRMPVGNSDVALLTYQD